MTHVSASRTHHPWSWKVRFIRPRGVSWSFVMFMDFHPTWAPARPRHCWCFKDMDRGNWRSSTSDLHRTSRCSSWGSADLVECESLRIIPIWDVSFIIKVTVVLKLAEELRLLNRHFHSTGNIFSRTPSCPYDVALSCSAPSWWADSAMALNLGLWRTTAPRSTSTMPSCDCFVGFLDELMTTTSLMRTSWRRQASIVQLRYYDWPGFDIWAPCTSALTLYHGDFWTVILTGLPWFKTTWVGRGDNFKELQGYRIRYSPLRHGRAFGCITHRIGNDSFEERENMPFFNGNDIIELKVSIRHFFHSFVKLVQTALWERSFRKQKARLARTRESVMRAWHVEEYFAAREASVPISSRNMALFPGFALCSTPRVVDIAWRSTTLSASCTHICVTLSIAESHCGAADAAIVRREAQDRPRTGRSVNSTMAYSHHYKQLDLAFQIHKTLSCQALIYSLRNRSTWISLRMRAGKTSNGWSDELLSSIQLRGMSAGRP